MPSDAGCKSTWSECIHLLHGWAVSDLGILTFCQLYATLRETILYHEQTKHENKNKELSGKKTEAWTISQKMTRPITKRAEQN